MARRILETSILFAIANIVVISAKKISREVYDLTPLELIKKEGYNAEEHEVVTEDGYILTLHRIPGIPGSPPVLLQHGIIASSIEWLLSGRENSLGFYLADKEYDVWMGNARGNMYSRRHVKYDPSESRFWNFSWHEMGIYDIPAVIEYITATTNDRLLYVGHSMGTTMLFVSASEKPEIATKLKAMFALAPVAFLDHSNSVLNLIVPVLDSLETMLQSFQIYEIIPPDLKRLFQNFVEQRCMDEDGLNVNNLCAKLVHLIGGYNTSRFNYTVAPMALNKFPRGTSVKTFTHFLQVKRSAQFRQYDYGLVKNIQKYNKYEPPEYNISRIQVPIGIFWSPADYFTQTIDVKRLYELLPIKLFNYKIPDKEFGHLDFLFSLDAAKYVHSILASAMEKYRQTKIINDVE